MRISDWSSDVCSSDLIERAGSLRRQSLRVDTQTFECEILRDARTALVVDDLEKIALDAAISRRMDDLQDRFQPIVEARRAAVQHQDRRISRDKLEILATNTRAAQFNLSGKHGLQDNLAVPRRRGDQRKNGDYGEPRSEEQSTRLNSVTNAQLVCRLLLEKKKKRNKPALTTI